MLTKIFIGIAVVVVVFVVIVAMQPSQSTITRSMTMPVAANQVFAQVNDFHNWQAWSPWAKMDPDAKNAFEGPPSGVGAGFSWSGNNKVGEGRMTIAESKPSEMIRIKLEFIKPFANVCDTLFTFKPEGNQTTVTWTMTGPRPFMAKMFCLFVNVDKMVGGQFEQGLAGMQVAAQKAASATK